MDLSQIPTEELMRLRAQSAPPPQSAPAAPDLGSMTTEQLIALRGQLAPPSAEPQGENRAWYQKFGAAADDMARIIANGATLGLADRFAGAMSGRGYDAERADTLAARDRAGTAAIAGDVIGGAAPAGAAVNLGARAVGAVAPQVAANAGLGMRTLGMAGVGAGLGATEAAIKEENVGQGALTGAVAGAAGNVIGEGIARGVNRVAGAFNPRPNIPSADELADRARAAYQRADDAGVIYTPQAMQRVTAGAIQDFTERGSIPALNPRAHAALGELQRQAEGNVTLKGVDTLRRVASQAYEPGNNANNALVRALVGRIDDMVTTPQSGDVLTGQGRAAAEAIREARDLYSRSAKSEDLAQALARAQRRVDSTGSGGNIDNAIRQEARRLLEQRRGWTPDERSALEQVISGTPTQNALRLVGKLSPSGNGLMAALGVGATAANPLMAIPAGIGIGAKMMADNSTRQNVALADALVRAGGSRAALEAPPNAVQRLTESKRQALINILTGGAVAVAP